jgi:hypothetical protein
MKRTAMLLITLVLAGCGDTDVANRGGELEPGQEIEDMGMERDVEAVDLDTVAWFNEGRTVEFNDRTWIVAGEPIFDPDVTYVGEFEGTPLYAEVGVSSPYNGLYIPLENDYWQFLEEGGVPAPDTADTTGTAGTR